MKKLLIIIGLTISFNAHSQIKFLGKSESFVKDSLEKMSFVFMKKDVKYKSDNRVVILTYHPVDADTADNCTRSFIFLNDTCKEYIVEGFLKDLPPLVSALDHAYKRIDSKHWIDAEATLEGELYMDNNGFSIGFKKI
jgi:hypothetical protein